MNAALKLHPTAVWMLQALSRPWPSANARRLNPACHVASSVTLANAGHFTKPHTLVGNKPERMNYSAAEIQRKENQPVQK